METRVTQMLGLEHPIVQAPIGATPELAAAVANAGGLGMLGISWTPVEGIGPLIARTRSLTRGSVGVNLVLVGDQQARLDAALAAGIRLVSFFWGDPEPYIGKAKSAGALTTMTVGSAEEARRALRSGIDIIVAQGVEAGGHVWGNVGTFVLVPAVRDAIGDKPLIAAGGIADGRGLAAAVALGADAVWMGTRFVASREADTHDVYRQAVVDATETDTLLTTLFDLEWPNAPHRALVNSTVRRWRAAGSPGLRPGEGEVVARRADGSALRRYADDSPGRGTTGDIEAMCLYAGQSAGLVGSEMPAGAIVKSISADAERILGRTA
jgi:NAD(P)H-dependent flavin oxidoreductase YrpB (nitropropane dioxygenase family)